MEYIQFHILFVAPLLGSIFSSILGLQQRVLPDLRQVRVEGMVGLFVVNRDWLERELQNRKQQDAVCGTDMKIELPSTLPHSSYNESYEGEVMFVHETITDETLNDELSPDLKEEVATSFQFLTVAIPVVVGNEKHSGSIFSSNLLTNTSKKTLFPFSTNPGETKQVDSIEKGEDGVVTVRLGDDFLVYQVKEKIKDSFQTDVGKDFDKVNGKVITSTSYPLPFNWGCDVLGPQIGYCQVLEESRCELAAVDGDVCAIISSNSSQRSPTTMVIVHMTGIFREMFPYLAETVPSESFEAELIDSEEVTGIKYPCLTKVIDYV